MRYRFLLIAAAVSACTGSPDEPATDATPEPEAQALVEGTAPRASGGFPSVVLLHPLSDVDLPVPEEPAVMDQRGNDFLPRILVVRVGQPVDFKNSEDVLHNVHVQNSETRETEFNVGTPVVGSYRHRFEKAGAYDVSCNIHPWMAAYVIVTPTPYTAIADSQGRFHLEGAPAGDYRLVVWNLDPGRRIEQQVSIGSGRTTLPELKAADS